MFFRMLININMVNIREVVHILLIAPPQEGSAASVWQGRRRRGGAAGACAPALSKVGGHKWV